MARLTDLLKSFVSPTDEIKTPSFIKPERSVPPPPPEAPKNPPRSHLSNHLSGRNTSPGLMPKQIVQDKKLPLQNALYAQNEADKIEVPVYQSDSEWDVVQRSINLFADHADLKREVKEAFVKKWVTELEKAEQTSLYRNEEETEAHLGNKINRSNADDAKGLLGTYQAMIHPGRQARMNDELKALQCIEKFDLGIVDWQLCREFKMDLIMIVIGTIEEQKKAAQNLYEKAQTGQPEAEKIYLATKSLSSKSEMRLNSAIKTAVIKMDTAKYQINRQTFEQNEPESAVEPLPTSAKKSAEAQKTTAGEVRKEPAKPAVSESTWVDEQALKLFGNLRS